MRDIAGNGAWRPLHTAQEPTAALSRQEFIPAQARCDAVAPVCIRVLGVGRSCCWHPCPPTSCPSTGRRLPTGSTIRTGIGSAGMNLYAQPDYLKRGLATGFTQRTRVHREAVPHRQVGEVVATCHEVCCSTTELQAANLPHDGIRTHDPQIRYDV